MSRSEWLYLTIVQDGFQTTERIRKDPQLAKFKHVPIIAVTASESATDRQKAIDVGIDDFTLKPLHAEYLKVLLGMALRKGQERAEKARAECEAEPSEIEQAEVEQAEVEQAAVEQAEIESSERPGKISGEPTGDITGGVDDGTKTKGTMSPSSSSLASSSRSERTVQLIPAEGEIPEVTLTSATPAEKEVPEVASMRDVPSKAD